MNTTEMIISTYDIEKIFPNISKNFDYGLYITIEEILKQDECCLLFLPEKIKILSRRNKISYKIDEFLAYAKRKNQI